MVSLSSAFYCVQWQKSSKQTDRQTHTHAHTQNKYCNYPSCAFAKARKKEALLLNFEITVKRAKDFWKITSDKVMKEQ